MSNAHPGPHTQRAFQVLEECILEEMNGYSFWLYFTKSVLSCDHGDCHPVRSRPSLALPKFVMRNWHNGAENRV
jgi:hypothetical protein